MNGEDIIQWLGIISTFICLPLSVILARRKLHNIDRVFPLLCQLILLFGIFNSFNHGFPGELFKIMVFDIFWSIIALIISYRLLRIQTWPTRIFAWSQFTQVISLLILAFSAYAVSCWRHYGHI